MAKLERLTKVPLRDFWEEEAGDFTPWLADEENINLLGETIGVELEVEAQEKNVGPFRADILCKDTVTNSSVLIENQLERTNHTHLGQLLTYAAGLEAVTVVWIAERFTEEHRAALDWLNEITDEGFSFFGLEIELWRIGDSPMAPKFNVVSHPNDWAKTASRISRSDLSPTNQLYLEYWIGLRDLLKERNGVINPVKALPQNWLSFGIGRSHFSLETTINKRDRWVCVNLTLIGEDSKPHFNLLKQDRIEIEQEVSAELEWSEKAGGVESDINLFQREIDLEDRQDWNRQHQWLCEKLETFHKVFSPRVKKLDASNYFPEEDETDE